MVKKQLKFYFFFTTNTGQGLRKTISFSRKLRQAGSQQQSQTFLSEKVTASNKKYQTIAATTETIAA